MNTPAVQLLLDLDIPPMINEVPPQPSTVATYQHQAVIGDTHFVCIDDDCEGVRHVWCSCE